MSTTSTCVPASADADCKATQRTEAPLVLLGDEAVARGACDAGITAAYAYPGTPSTEILEYVMAQTGGRGRPIARWCANEKTAYEEAMGVAFAGKRALVAMKHVGLNVAADPFMNSALVSVHGGLVLAVADDPGMHSSQNEQDSRWYADFARIICLEPANQQEAYEMTREAFDLSERFRIPVMIRLVTRLAHSRAVVRVSEPRGENAAKMAPDISSWILLPSNAKRQWRDLLNKQPALSDYTLESAHNRLDLIEAERSFGVITTGIARNYLLENLDDLAIRPSHLHIGAYPLPLDKVRVLADHVKTLLVLEEGYPIVERLLRGIRHGQLLILGKETGEVPAAGELTPDIVRQALGLTSHRGVDLPTLDLPSRPPQLCSGCPHGDSYDALKKALLGFESPVVTSDIGCYTLGALPPYSAIQTCVCMGASVSMATGAAEAGCYPVLAVIGDSTFVHSGVTPLMDAVSANTDMTLIILDNETVAMTGGQPSLLPTSRLAGLILGLGIDPDHFQVISAHRRDTEKNAEIIRREIAHRGLSVIIAVRECIETAKKRKRG
ncbi:MAG: indolepyruvate ferredoxin oxidoreductase [Acidobacteria bacterium]|nr:indolepyruvate ferredoxin oxidoreductase [Acidobacteriota bacterium]